ncbi:hypothetical protein BH10ACT8_BH10ACT8_08540 [soil metagenome]
MNLAETLIRRLPSGVGFEHAGQQLARGLHACADGVPEGSHLLLGGSLARGEPLLRVNGGSDLLISDIDLLLVHDTLLPPFAVDKFVRRHRSALPTITLMSLSGREYQRLTTSIGYDFKDGRVALTDRSPEFETVVVDPRDAFEVFIFGILLALLGDSFLESRADASRAVGKVIRSVGLLDNVNAQHDFHSDREALAEAHRHQLRFLRDPSKSIPPERPHELLSVFAAGLTAHDYAAGLQRDDAVEGSRFDGRPGSDTVREVQRALVLLLRRMIAAPPDEPPADKCVRAWRSIVADHVVRPYASTADFCRSTVPLLRHALLDMKVRSDD